MCGTVAAAELHLVERERHECTDGGAHVGAIGLEEVDEHVGEEIENDHEKATSNFGGDG